MAISSSQNVSEPRLTRAVWTFQLVILNFFGHGIPLENLECVGLILFTAESSIHSTRPGKKIQYLVG